MTSFGTTLHQLWKTLKRWRHIGIGPVGLHLKLERRVKVLQSRASSDDAPVSAPGAVAVGKAGGYAVIVGVGPGFGHALAHSLAGEGMGVVLVARNADRLSALVDAIKAKGGSAFAYGCDATHESRVLALFTMLAARHGVPALVVYSLQNFGPGDAVDIELSAFEDGFRHNCLGAFLVARSAARAMLPVASGTIILVGSTSSLIGRAGHLNLAVGKFAQRALAQVLARELWPQGIHVAHLVIDADIKEDETAVPYTQSYPDHIAQALISIYRQPRTAWSSEIDLRPWNEEFWQHC